MNEANEANKPIGVFDSGIGGLTVLEQLIKQFPNENFIYVADQGHCPYGTKTPEQIGERVEKITRYMISREVKAIVIACNTASVRIDRARAVTDKPVISVIDPTCAKAVALTKKKKVAVLATVSTIESGTYQKLLEKSGVTPVPLACSEFVDFLENNSLDDPAGDIIVRGKLQQIKDSGIDVLIHGCTHFSLLEPAMRKVLGDGITYVACGAPTGERLGRILGEGGFITDRKGAGVVEIYTTGDVLKAEKSMGWFTCVHEPLRHIDIE